MDNIKSLQNKLMGALVGGVAGGLVWGLSSGFMYVELVKAALMGSISFLIAELFASIPRRVWSRSLLFGFSGGITMAIMGVLLFPIEGSFYSYIFSTFFGILVGGSIYYYWVTSLSETKA